MARRQSNGEEFKAMTARAAQTDIEPPAHTKLKKAEMPFWYAITRTRYASSWTGNDLVQAANLARVYARIEHNEKLLSREDDVITTEFGKIVANPRLKILSDLRSQAVQIARAIQVHATATQGESKLQQKKNKVQQEAIYNRQEEDGDDLYARPVH